MKERRREEEEGIALDKLHMVQSESISCCSEGERRRRRRNNMRLDVRDRDQTMAALARRPVARNDHCRKILSPHSSKQHRPQGELDFASPRSGWIAVAIQCRERQRRKGRQTVEKELQANHVNQLSRASQILCWRAKGGEEGARELALCDDCGGD